MKKLIAFLLVLLTATVCVVALNYANYDHSTQLNILTYLSNVIGKNREWYRARKHILANCTPHLLSNSEEKSQYLYSKYTENLSTITSSVNQTINNTPNSDSSSTYTSVGDIPINDNPLDICWYIFIGDSPVKGAIWFEDNTKGLQPIEILHFPSPTN